jgi:ABC-type uncharacterized transport system substrate-binding protein
VRRSVNPANAGSENMPSVPPPPIAVVLSSREPAYLGVAEALAQQFGDFTVYDLANLVEPPVATFRRIRDTNARVVVAIGLRAAVSATSLSSVPVVFCQVFNRGDHNLLSPGSRGVAAQPPLDLQIAAWKKLDPELRSVGAIVGPGHDDLITEARHAAASHDVVLHIETASSDRETLYLFNRMVHDIDGFMLFPDNRVLSSSVLRKMLNDAARQHVQVAVFNDSLLRMGAAFSSTTVDADIAARIVDVLEQIAADGIDSVPEVSPLTEVRIVTNDAVLQRLLQGDNDSRRVALVKEQ